MTPVLALSASISDLGDFRFWISDCEGIITDGMDNR